MVNTSSFYSDCKLCPNMCQVTRYEAKGRCRTGSLPVVAWSGLHRGEEPPISGENGSGMIFFSGCPLHCAFCQNIQISGGDSSLLGLEVSEDELSDMMIALEEMGAHSLNLVTGTHFIPSIVNAIEKSRKKGMGLKVVWNSSGYESVEALSLIDEYIDLYLLDCKSLDRDVSARFAGLGKYADNIIPVMDFIKQRKPRTDLDNLSGTVLRHLLFPGEIKSTRSVLEYFSKHYKDNFVLSMMVQFVPPRENPGFEKVSEEEYDEIISYFDEFGIEDGFIQELGDDIPWIPDFRRDNPFPLSFATPSPYFLSLKKERL